MVKGIKEIMRKMLFCTQKIWYRKWMERLTTVVLILLAFNLPLICGTVFLNMKYALAYNICKIVISQYLGFSKVVISAYTVAFVGAMTKELAAKSAEEKIKLEREVKKLKKQEDSE